MSTASTTSLFSRVRNGITTLYIGPLADELRHDKIFSHFSAFGEVSDLRIHNEQKYSYKSVNNVRICNVTKHSHGFVKFTRAESAAKVLGVDFHLVAGRRVDVAVADDKYQDWTTLLDLNDDCILEILSMKCLSVVDLCAAAESCRRLKGIAGRVFKREHKTCDIRSLSEEKTKLAKRILSNFGSVISDLRIHGDSKDKWIRKVLDSEYCSGNTLQSLELRYLQIPENFMAMLKPLFSSLQKLTLCSCSVACTVDVVASRELFADCGSLVELTITDVHCYFPAFVHVNTFPKLQKFKIACTNVSNSLASFISRHMNLKSLKIQVYDIGAPVLKLIADNKQLEELNCSMPKKGSFNLSKLRHLRKLEIDCLRRNCMTAATGLNNLKVLEHLTVRDANIDSKFIRTLAQLKGLQALVLWKCTGLQILHEIVDPGQLTTLEIRASSDHFGLDVAALVKCLTKLNCLTVVKTLRSFDLETYLRVVDAVRQRPDKTKLTFRLCCEYGSYDHLLPHFQRNAHVVEMITEN